MATDKEKLKKSVASWEEALKRDKLLDLSYSVLIHALQSKNVKQSKKIEIALALVKRRIPQDMNVNENVKIQKVQVEFVS